MIAFDTNLLVRVVVADHPAQVAIVRKLISEDTVFISRTVLLECEWVLRSRYKKTRQELAAFFVALARSFVAKAVLNLPATEALIVRLKVDVALRRCGFDHRHQVAPCTGASHFSADRPQSAARREDRSCPPTRSGTEPGVKLIGSTVSSRTTMADDRSEFAGMPRCTLISCSVCSSSPPNRSYGFRLFTKDCPDQGRSAADEVNVCPNV